MKDEELFDIEILDDIDIEDEKPIEVEPKNEEITFEESSVEEINKSFDDDIFQEEPAVFEEVPPSENKEVVFEEDFSIEDEKTESADEDIFQDDSETFEEISSNTSEDAESDVIAFAETPSTFEEVPPSEGENKKVEEPEVEESSDDDLFKETPPASEPVDSGFVFEDSAKVEEPTENPEVEETMEEATEEPFVEKTDEEPTEEPKPIPAVNKEELLGKTYNLADDLKKAEEETAEEPSDKKSMIFIAFLFAFLILFVIALPYLARIFG